MANLEEQGFEQLQLSKYNGTKHKFLEFISTHPCQISAIVSTKPGKTDSPLTVVGLSSCSTNAPGR
ncbi:MAG: hypothetical protein F6K26_18090 [Moorea sp. SIO2I5]|nr:hypothetical protein [Moorena sp. SIO2I5]